MYSSQPRLAAIVSELRIAVVIVPDAAEASWCASNVSFDWMTPAGVQQLVDQCTPQIEYDAVPGVRHAVLRDERADAAEDEHADHGKRQPVRARRIGILEIVDDRNDEHRHDQIAGGDAQNQWNLVMATAMMAMIPPALVVMLMQKWFVKGLVDTEK